MRIEPILAEIDAALQAQLRLADPELLDTANHLYEALRPAVRSGLVRAVEHAAAEVGAQLGDTTVDVRLIDGEPELAVTSAGRATPDDTDDVEARLTLRLPSRLKNLIEDAASTSGESINGWVVDALRSGTNRRSPGTHVNETIDF